MMSIGILIRINESEVARESPDQFDLLVREPNLILGVVPEPWVQLEILALRLVKRRAPYRAGWKPALPARSRASHLPPSSFQKSRTRIICT